MKHILGSAVLVFSLSAFAASSIKDEALKFVPGGTVVAERAEEVKIKAPSGSIVEVEFDRSGNFEEASGNSVHTDVFVPGNDLMSLSDTVASVNKAGKKPVGEWSLDNSLIRGWHYEFEGFENGKKMDYTVDAKNGKLLDSKMDD